jgi:O-antigen/teichoic acid export membrane protein
VREPLLRASVGGFLLSSSSTALQFLISMLLARGLGASRYGAYAYAVSWTVVLGVLGDFGLGRLLVRNIASYHARGEWALLRGQLIWAIVIALVASTCTGLAALLMIPLNGLLRGSQAAT